MTEKMKLMNQYQIGFLFQLKKRFAQAVYLVSSQGAKQK